MKNLTHPYQQHLKQLHGVALDVAGKDGSNFSSLLEAFKAAKKLIK